MTIISWGNFTAGITHFCITVTDNINAGDTSKKYHQQLPPVFNQYNMKTPLIHTP
ncbi:hypothetical protein [Ferruginibacter sp.]